MTVTFNAFSRMSPPRRVSPRTFLPIRPRLSTILCKYSTFFSFGCHPLEGVTRSGPVPRPLVTPLCLPIFILNKTITKQIEVTERYLSILGGGSQRFLQCFLRGARTQLHQTSQYCIFVSVFGYLAAFSYAGRRGENDAKYEIQTPYFVTFRHILLQLKCTWSSVSPKF